MGHEYLAGQVIPADALLQHWQGHRRLTRRVIEAFPEDQLFSFSIGGMRTFGAMCLELIGIATPMVRGVVTGDWQQPAAPSAPSKGEVLRLWDDEVPRRSMSSGRRSRLSDSVRR